MNARQIQRAIADGVRLELKKMAKKNVAVKSSRESVCCCDCTEEQLEHFRKIQAKGVCVKCSASLKEDKHPDRQKRLMCSLHTHKFYAAKRKQKDKFAFERRVVDALEVAPSDFIHHSKNEYAEHCETPVHR